MSLSSAAQSQVIDFAQAAQKRTDLNRRRFERILFKNILGAAGYIESESPVKVELLNISKDGLGFSLPAHRGKFELGQSLKVRLYFTADEYLFCNVSVRHAELNIVEGVETLQYGAEFDKDLKSFEAVSRFVEFIDTFAKFSKKN